MRRRSARRAWKTAHLAAFTALAALAVLSVERVIQPSMTRHLLLALGLGLLAALPGYLEDWLLPSSLILVPAGLYVLLRLVLPLPPEIESRADEAVFYLEELRGGLRAYSEDVFPLSLGAVSGLRVFVLSWVYVMVALAAVLGLGVGRPLLGGAVLIGMLGFTLTVDTGEGLAHPGLFLMLVALVLATSEAARRHGRRPREILGGLGLGAASLALAVLVLGAVPGLARPGWTDWRTWDPFDGGGRTVFVFNWKQNYPRLLDPGNRTPVMRVTSPVPSYWRATTLEFFSGDAWLSDGAFRSPLPDGPGPREIRVDDPEPPGSLVEQRFELAGTSTNYLFTGGHPLSLTLDREEAVYSSEAGALRTATILGSPLEYSITAVVPRVSPDELVGTSTDYPEDVRRRYLSLPFPDAATALRMREEADGPGSGAADPSPPGGVMESAPRGDEYAGIYELNRLIVGDATDPYDVTLRIERFLRANYRYSLEVPASTYASPIAAFLFGERVGYCQHFAGAMALLLRLNGIPSRVAVGFTRGDPVGTWTYVVTTNNAHAWVEAYFQGIGWLPLEPTPGRPFPVPGPSSASPGFVDPFERVDGGGLPQSPLPAPDATDRLPEEADFGAGGEQAGIGRTVRLWAVLAITAALLLGWPGVLRRIRESPARRGSMEDRLRAGVRLLRADLAVAGTAVGASSTLDQAALQARETLGLDLGPLARRAQEVLFGGRPADRADLRALQRARRTIRRVAWKRRKVWTLAAWYGVTPDLARRLRPQGTRDEPPRPRGATWRL